MTRIWTLSLDGNAATCQQVQALAEGIAQELPAGSAVTESYFPLVPSGSKKLSNTNLVTSTAPLSALELAGLSFNGPSFSDGWPDYVLSCRPEVAAIALGIKQANSGHTRVIHIQNPNDVTGTYNFDLSVFDVIVRQPQEKLRGKNVISSKMALHGMAPERADSFNVAASLKQADIECWVCWWEAATRICFAAH
jgi:mitochondrial fission protein ELM1